MWHEARKQERKIRGMMVDYRRRAERRRDFYEKIKADPTQFLQLHGRQCKIHLDASIASAADSPATMMPWQGQADNLIDRFDVRAHLDYIPPLQNQEDIDLNYEERQINYERYRIIAQNSFLSISEEKFLKQLHMEEQYGYMEPESKKKKAVGAAIGFNYEDGTGYSVQSSTGHADDNSDANSDSDLDVDLYINVSKVDQYQAHELNKHGLGFGMSSNDLYSFLTDDMEEAESNRLAREEEHEKALFSGRKSRRERRAHREKRLANRVLSPPSYAARSSPTYPTFRDSNSASRSPSPANTGKITYITSFGDDDEAPTSSKPNNSNKQKRDGKLKRCIESSPESRVVTIDKSERERSYRRKRRSVSSDSRSARTRQHSRSRRRSPSRNRYRRRPYSRTRNRHRYRRRSSSSSSYGRRSRSRSRGRNRSYSRNRYPRRIKSSSSSSNSSNASRKSHSASRKFPKSKSPSVKRDSPPKVTVQRYYGRKRSDQSSSSDMENASDAGNANMDTNNQMDVEPEVGENDAVTVGNAGSASKKGTPIYSTVTMTVQERLKRKRQALLNKQYKADKLAEQQKTEREKQEQQNREDELREMAIKLRRRQRELRHAYESNSSDSSSDSDSSSSSSSNKNQDSYSRSPKDKFDGTEYWPKEFRSETKTGSYSSSSRSSPNSNSENKEEQIGVRNRESTRETYSRGNREADKSNSKSTSGTSLVNY